MGAGTSRFLTANAAASASPRHRPSAAPPMTSRPAQAQQGLGQWPMAGQAAMAFPVAFPHAFPSLGLEGDGKITRRTRLGVGFKQDGAKMEATAWPPVTIGAIVLKMQLSRAQE